jgi:hypothetical protein
MESDGKKKPTKIHLDLDSIFVIKTDLDQVVFGLFKYASGKGFKPPFIFTANTSVQDNSYLGVLKNNNVRLLDEPPSAEDVDILFAGDWKKSLNHLMLITNMPIFTKIEKSRACVYIDWDNIQVSSEYISALLEGVNRFIHDIKVHKAYEFYVFLHNKVSKSVKQMMKKFGVHVINIIKDKSKSGDEEIFRFIRRNTRPGDSLCVASGDRDFSSLMVEYVMNSYNVFLLYNKQALYTFKHNRHWLGSVDVKSLEGVGSKTDTSDRSLSQSQKTMYKTKPCKFYNLDVCNAVSCSFLHICGVCGRPHKMKDFHPGVTVMKNVICKKYNNGTCNKKPSDCDYLHVCIKCKKSHRYINCKYMVMYCPLCKVNMDSVEKYVMHQFDPTHLARISAVKKIVEPIQTDQQESPPDKNHVLVV